MKWLCRLLGIMSIVLMMGVAFRPGLVYGAEIQVGDTLPLQRTDWQDHMSIPKFDPQVGVLQAVKIQLTGTLQGSAKFESLDAKPTMIVVKMSAQIELQRPDGSQLVTSIPQTTTPTAIEPFDGQIDYGGASGRTFDNLISTDESEIVTLTDRATLALFIGNGTIDLPVNSVGAAEATGAGNLAVGFQTNASAAITVTYDYANPAVVIEKLTNGEDADTPTGPMLNLGDPVTWTYLITNTGAIDLVDLVLIDDQEGDVTWACPQTILAVGASMHCTVVGTAALGQYRNTAVVTGTTPSDPAGNSISVTAGDPSHYLGVGIPAIDLEKLTNGVDADDIPGPYVQAGATVTWTYLITNTGNLDLVDLTLFDDQLGDISAACADRHLDVGMTISCVVTGTAHMGQYTNTAMITGTTAPDAWPPGVQVTDSDPSHYYAEQLPLCPDTLATPVSLPDVRFLGEGPGEYNLPGNYDHLIVKKFGLFHFEVIKESLYLSTRPASLYPERVWACSGACTFVQAYEQLVTLGRYPAGMTLELVVIDDDDDHRINALVANGQVNQPVEQVTEQTMVEFLRFALPFDAEWGYNANDSIGIVYVCAH